MNINMGRILWNLQLFVVLAIGGVIPNDVIQFTNDNSNSDDLVVKAAEKLMDDPSFLIKVKALMEYTAVQDGYTMNANGEADVNLRALIKINLTDLLRLIMSVSADLLDSTLCSGTVNGGWGGWSDYDDCSVTCGPGTKSRSRQCNNPPPSNGGDGCVGDNTETIDCNRGTCPVNGGWGGWSNYDDCSVTCGPGTKSRSRQCNNPPPSNGGDGCDGDNTETIDCNQGTCPVNGGWGGWSNYDDCSVTCGPGTKSRSRQCNNPPPSNGGDGCDGDNTETMNCNQGMCPVNGGWGGWSNYDDCSVTCGPGTKSRSRQCNNPPPSNGGDGCDGDNTETMNCNQGMCPVNGGWGGWSNYDDCSVTCGPGTKSRSRQCNNPPPSNGGDGCDGDNTETMNCNQGMCPVNGGWGGWSNYDDCSVTCGPGTKSRSRQCNNPPPSNGGDGCDGDNTETMNCNQGMCPEDKCVSSGNYEYDSISQTCIWLSTYMSSASTAQYMCDYYGLRLYKMDTLEKIAFLRRTVTQFYHQYGWYSYGVFVGAFETGHGDFKWVDGTPVNWYTGLPLSNGQYCLRLDTSNWEMDETWCDNQFQFACEKIV